jgi:Fe2+ or Zn2+ uptake regulation protein
MTHADILERLRASGYRLTGPRRTLVETLLQAEAPLSADDVYLRVRPAGMNLSTVYRNLAAFVEMGWLTVVRGVNGKQHYRVRSTNEPSFSIVCLDCGKLNQVAAAPDAVLRDTVRGLGFKTESLQVTLAAHCEHICEKRNGPAQ